MNNDTYIFFGILGLFILAGVIFLLGCFSRMPGLLLIICGVSVLFYSQTMTTVQRQLAEKKYAPSHWKDVRPLTYKLWGIGVAIVGLAWIINGKK